MLVSYGSDFLSRRGRTLGTGGFRGLGEGERARICTRRPTACSIVGGYALVAQRHMHEFGTTSEQLAEIAVGVREFAGLNPNAMYREPITVADVLASRVIADPLHLLDCCVVTDGGGAFLMTTAERARDLRKPAVRVLGAAGAQTHWNISQMPDYTTSAGATCIPEAFARAGVRPSDVDTIQFYDSFTITVLVLLEDAGFCKKGEGGALRRAGTPAARRAPSAQHRRRRALGVPLGHARPLPDRRGRAPAARRGRRRAGAGREARARGRLGRLALVHRRRRAGEGVMAMEVVRGRSWDRPQLAPGALDRAFFEAAARGELLYQRCPACGHRQFYPRAALHRLRRRHRLGDGLGPRRRAHLHDRAAERAAAVQGRAALRRRDGRARGRRAHDGQRHRLPGRAACASACRVEAYAVECGDGMAVPFWRPSQ